MCETVVVREGVREYYTVLAFVLLRNSRFNFHCYTQCEATPTQKSARKWYYLHSVKYLYTDDQWLSAETLGHGDIYLTPREQGKPAHIFSGLSASPILLLRQFSCLCSLQARYFKHIQDHFVLTKACNQVRPLILIVFRFTCHFSLPFLLKSFFRDQLLSHVHIHCRFYCL